MPYRVASVPFLNAKPLVWAFEREQASSPVQVTYDVPSRLPAVLDSGAADAVLVSSIDALSSPSRRIAAGCSISSKGRVRSVRLFSRVPFGEVGSLALDSSSLTSNVLAQIVMREMFGRAPECTREAPDGRAMLDTHDACLLIGDNGLTFTDDGLFQLDLGEAWTNLTGLPFVWACWVGLEGLTPTLVQELVWAREVGEQNLSAIAGEAPETIHAQTALAYLTEVFDYGLDSDQLWAMELFGQKAFSHGLVADCHMPEVVEPETAASLA